MEADRKYLCYDPLLTNSPRLVANQTSKNHDIDKDDCAYGIIDSKYLDRITVAVDA